MTKFIDAAYAEMIRQKEVEYKKQVGSQRPAGPETAGKEKTDCITYVIKTLSKAFTQVGETDAAKTTRSLYEDGSDLAKYLVEQQDWTGYYWNPDVRHPSDNDSEHPSTYQEAQRTGLYYGIPITGYIINYRPHKPATKLDRQGLDWLRKVKFGYGIARGARHTFLVSFAEIYEVHWEEIGDKLYSKTPLESPQWKWLSGAIVVPPGTTSLLIG